MEHHRPMTATMMPWKPALDAGAHPQSSAFGDTTTFTKIFVGGLAWETHSEALRRHYEPCGDILEAVVIYDKNTGRSKGYGFVTFRDPESTRMACADPSPIIDGRQANCNLASLGRSQPAPPYEQTKKWFFCSVSLLRLPYPKSLAGHLRPVAPYLGGSRDPLGTYVGSSIYQHDFPFGYQQSISYVPYGYTAYGSEYVPQNVYFPYTSQQHIQFHGVHGTVNTTGYPYGHIVQPVAGVHGYSTVQSYTLPGHQLAQLTGPNLISVATGSVPGLQLSYSTGAASAFPSHTQFLVSAQSPQFAQGSGPEPTAG